MQKLCHIWQDFHTWVGREEKSTPRRYIQWMGDQMFLSPCLQLLSCTVHKHRAPQSHRVLPAPKYSTCQHQISQMSVDEIIHPVQEEWHTDITKTLIHWPHIPEEICGLIRFLLAARKGKCTDNQQKNIRLQTSVNGLMFLRITAL